MKAFFCRFFPYLLLLVLLPGNLFLGIYFWRTWRLAERKFALSSDAQYRYNALDPRFTVVADAREPESEFRCLSENDFVGMQKKEGKIWRVSAQAGDDELDWAAANGFYFFAYGTTGWIDFDQDFLFDARFLEKEETFFIRLNDLWLPVLNVSASGGTITAVDEKGKNFRFQNGSWHEVR